MARMIEFLYTADYPGLEADTSDTGCRSELVLHADVYAAAMKYNLVSLGDRAMSQFLKSVSPATTGIKRPGNKSR
jgi:hypothetical protein